MVLVQQEAEQKMIKDDSLKRYSNHLVLKEIGGHGQNLIKNSKVLIIGLGGLGSPVLQYSIGSGIGTIGLIDNDVVDVSNLHRQTIFSMVDIGKYKVDIAKEYSNKINSNTKIISYKYRLNKKNAEKIINKFDFVVDCTDNHQSKLIINDECYNSKKPLIYGSVAGFFGQVSTFKPYKNNKKNIPYPSYRSMKILNNNEEDCNHNGILGPIAGVIGSLQATELIKQIIGHEDNLLGKLLIFDGLTNNTRIIKMKNNLDNMATRIR